MSSFGERLREERERLDFNQTAFGAIGGVQKQAQLKYEKGERFPDALYLESVAKVGADIQYIVTGQRSSQALTADEQVLLDGYRGMDKATQKRMLAFVLGGDVAPKRQGQVFNGTVGQPINVEGNFSQPGVSFFGKGEKGKKE